MQTLNIKLFDGTEHPLTVYNGQAIIDRAIRVYTTSICDFEEIETDFDFLDYQSSYFRVYNQREGRLLIEIALSVQGSYIIINASADDMTFEDIGNYYYEIGYVRNVYEQALIYGLLQVI